MELLITLGSAILAGLMSVGSPCVLPVLPIIITGGPNDSRARPLLIVGGLATTFIAMGILTALFGGLITSQMVYIEKAAGVLITIFGLFMLFQINVFKYLSFFSNIHVNSKGRWSGLVLGLTLGIIWIPCVGPFLSTILFQVASQGKVFYGIITMAFYSLGFAIPMLSVAYASHFTRKQLDIFKKNPKVVYAISGVLLIAFGIYITFWGLVGFGW